MNNMSIIELTNISKAYHNHIIFKNFNLTIKENHFTVITGESSTGKSTLLNIIGLLDCADYGSIRIKEHQDVKPYSSQARKLLRTTIGYLFQNFALLEQESVSYNLKIAKSKVKQKELIAALTAVGLSEKFLQKKVCQCSGGEQQRIAIARLLLKDCEIILADEPTGSLDHRNRNVIYQLLKDLQKQGKTIVVVSYDEDLIKLADDLIYLNQNANIS